MSIDGVWHLTMDSPMGKQKVTADLACQDGLLTGTVTNEGNQMKAEIFDGAVDGDSQSWKVKLNQIKITLVMQTTVEGDTMTGEAKAGLFGKFPVNGTRSQ